MTAQLDSWESRLLLLAYAPLGNHTVGHAPTSVDSSSLATAYTHSEEVTKEHSATFYLASSLLRHEQRRAIRALYAFCRVSDDLVDRPQADNNSAVIDAARFERWRKSALGNSAPQDDPVASAWIHTRRQFNIPHQYAEQLLDGVARDLEVVRYTTFSDLADYCYAVASTVGLMSMHIIGFKQISAIPYAVKLGVALQLTNILRDVAEDWANGRLYLPLEELEVFGLTEDDIATQNNDSRWKAFMGFQIARARQLYDEALPGLTLLERRGRLAVAAAAEMYRSILDDIESHDYDVFTRRAHVSNLRKVTSLPGIWWRSTGAKY